MNPTHFSRYALAGIAACVFTAGCASQSEAEYAWPSKMVGIAEMRPVERLNLALLVSRMSGSPAGTVVLRVHVDETGKVLRTSVLEGEATPRMDGAALGAMRKMKFAPFIENGRAIPVTVIVPLHFPALG
ncbi:energy transducer TonB [Paracidovorax valerianellae]|uniref:energy transducer TonB n=1 Tax=Paracidovorax valerianellae TaxID=187868 RepID=UPI00230265B1|nr:energy transducer TonB [Paracidovorax valerianellae]MDA8446342.1 energy transducer TonB [Paracidovorax valerianellae]